MNGHTDQCIMGKIVQDDPEEINTGQFTCEAVGLKKGLGFILKSNNQNPGNLKSSSRKGPRRVGICLLFLMSDTFIVRECASWFREQSVELHRSGFEKWKKLSKPLFPSKLIIATIVPIS